MNELCYLNIMFIFKIVFSTCPYNSKEKKEKKTLHTISYSNFFCKEMLILTETCTCFMMSFTNNYYEKKINMHYKMPF